MKYTKRIAILLTLLTLVVFLAGCAQFAKNTQPDKTIVSEATTEPAVEPEPKSAAIRVTDMTGREVTLDAPAERVVALTASDCEILFAIGAGETLVGRGEYCNYPEEAINVPSVQSGSETNIEQIIALKPQVVVMGKMAQTKEQVAALENAGIKVVVTDAHDIAGVYTAIKLIGAVVGRDAEAGLVIDGMKATFDDISAKAKAKSDGAKTIYFEVSPLEYGLWTAGKGTFMDELATMLGLTNAFADVNGWSEISQEQVIERNPDYIVTVTMYFGEGPSPVEEIMGRKGWQNMKAIKNKAVINVDSDKISRPGPRLADAIATLYSYIYENKTK